MSAQNKMEVDTMPQNKREDLIFSVLMVFIMAIWMCTYNIAIVYGGLSLEVLQEAWLAFPLAYLVAFLAEKLIVSKFAEWFAFRFLVKPTSKPWKITVAITCCIIVPMVIIMSVFGAIESCMATGEWSTIGWQYLIILPRNLAMALPFQLLVAGPLLRFIFRKLFPEGKILA